MYDLLIRRGLVLDSSQGLADRADVAVSRGRVAAVEPHIPESSAKVSIDAKGLVVSPGLIDIHAHVAWDVVRLSVDPVARCLLKGTTTVVDAGSTGELNFRPFLKYVSETSGVRILAFLNIESLGMIEFADVKPGNTDQRWPSLLTASKESFAEMFVNAEKVRRTLSEHKDTIVGIKWAHHGLRTMALARKAADAAGCILMIENRFMPAASKHVKKGDIVTHIYHDAFNPNSGYTDGLLQGGKIPSSFFRLAKDGVIFDVGHGQGSFSWKVAETALGEGLPPTTISSDLWSGNVDGPVYSLPTVMSKLLHLGMSLEDVFGASTGAAAAAIGRTGMIGTLRPGAVADISVFKVREGSFPLEDCYGKVKKVGRLIAPVAVIKGGRPVLKGGRPVVG